MADQDYVRKGLAPYEARIRRVADDGYADWVQSSDRSKFIYERTKACARFDHIARHAHAEFGTDKAVKIIAGHETVKLVFCNGTIVLRYKHEGEDGLGVNGQATQTVLAFINSERPHLPGMPPQHNVECCFRENELDTGLESITIVARHNYKKLWSYELPKPMADIVPFTAVPAPDQTPPAVRPRKTDADKKSDKDSDKNK